MDLDRDLQKCLGLSAIVVALATSLSILTGAYVELSVGNANLSVNRKLEKAEVVLDKAENIVDELKQEPTVSQQKIRGLENELRQGKALADKTEMEIEEDLDRYVEPEM